jgi:hypothetical protein
MEIVTGVGREITAGRSVEPKISQASQTTWPDGGRYARRVGGYTGNLKFLQQIITLVLKPASMARFPYNVS